MSATKIHRRALTALLALLIAWAPSGAAWAQDERAQKVENVFDDTMGDLYLIGALGAGGAILGLSTLSFVDKPTKHLKNIWIGGAIGIIVGVGVVAWKQATKTQEGLREGFVPVTPEAYHLAFQGPASRTPAIEEMPPSASWTFEF